MIFGSWLDRLWRWLRGPGGSGGSAAGGFDGMRGRPTSSNRASSFHLVWVAPSDELTQVSVVLEVRQPPTVPRLYFWALQASFVTDGRRSGAAHLGLQWHHSHPGNTAVNWGGYDAAGSILPGSASTLPSSTGNANTRDLRWQPGRRYRLRIHRAPGPAPADLPQGTVAWRGSVEDLTTGEIVVVRDLYAVGERLTAPMVWSEVFADCDHPGVTAIWSDLDIVDRAGVPTRVTAVRVNYQPVDKGGCLTTDSAAEAGIFVQRTGTNRVHATGSILRI